MKVLVEFEAVLDVVCVEESKISCLTNSTASTVRATTERFSGMKEVYDSVLGFGRRSIGVVHFAFGFPL